MHPPSAVPAARRTPGLARWTGLACIGLLGAGCLTPRSEIEGTDDAAFSGALAASWRLSPPEPRATSGADDPAWTQATWLDVEISATSGGFEQFVPAGEVVELDDVSFPGPADVDVDLDLYRLDLGARFEARQRTGFGANLYLGLELSQLDIEASSGGLSDSEGFFGVGPHLGVGLFYEPIERLRLRAEVRTALGFSDGFYEVQVNTVDLGARVGLTSSLLLEVGWREVHYDVNRDDTFESDLDLELSGLLVGLRLNL